MRPSLVSRINSKGVLRIIGVDPGMRNLADGVIDIHLHTSEVKDPPVLDVISHRNNDLLREKSRTIATKLFEERMDKFMEENRELLQSCDVIVCERQFSNQKLMAVVERLEKYAQMEDKAFSAMSPGLWRGILRIPQRGRVVNKMTSIDLCRVIFTIPGPITDHEAESLLFILAWLVDNALSLKADGIKFRDNWLGEMFNLLDDDNKYL